MIFLWIEVSLEPMGHCQLIEPASLLVGPENLSGSWVVLMILIQT